MTTKPPLQKILKGILYSKDENKQTMKGWELLNLRRKADNQKVYRINCTHTNS
jgi:hypothetical protein